MAFLTPELSRLPHHPGIGFRRVQFSTLRAVFASLRPAWSLALLDQSDLERPRSPAAEDFVPELSPRKVTLPGGRALLHGTRGGRRDRTFTGWSTAGTGCTQEIWGLAIGYNLVRLEMAHVAARAEVAPQRISYRHTLMLIRNFWLTGWLAPPGVLPRRLEALHDELALLLLPPRRSERRFPRAVKIKMSNYPLKRSRRSRRPRVK